MFNGRILVDFIIPWCEWVMCKGLNERVWFKRSVVWLKIINSHILISSFVCDSECRKTSFDCHGFSSVISVSI